MWRCTRAKAASWHAQLAPVLASSAKVCLLVCQLLPPLSSQLKYFIIWTFQALHAEMVFFVHGLLSQQVHRRLWGMPSTPAVHHNCPMVLRPFCADLMQVVEQLGHICPGLVVHKVFCQDTFLAQCAAAAPMDSECIIAGLAKANIAVTTADQKYAVVRLPSGEQRSVLSHCVATVGAVSNPQHKNTKIGKAGAARWLGRRPVVRGMAMNPVDHPHGGGRGKRKGRISQTPWGVPTKGYRTRKSNRTDQYIKLSRHKAA